MLCALYTICAVPPCVFVLLCCCAPVLLTCCAPVPLCCCAACCSGTQVLSSVEAGDMLRLLAALSPAQLRLLLDMFDPVSHDY